MIHLGFCFGNFGVPDPDIIVQNTNSKQFCDLEILFSFGPAEAYLTPTPRPTPPPPHLHTSTPTHPHRSHLFRRNLYPPPSERTYFDIFTPLHEGKPRGARGFFPKKNLRNTPRKNEKKFGMKRNNKKY